MVDQATIKILELFYLGDISIEEAADNLRITIDEFSDLIDENPWMPPCDKIEELDDIQSEFLSEYPIGRFDFSYNSKISMTKKYDVSTECNNEKTFSYYQISNLGPLSGKTITSCIPEQPIMTHYDCSTIPKELNNWWCDKYESN